MLRWIKTHFRNMPLRHKLILTLIIVVLIPVIMVGLFLTNELRERALDDATKQTENNVARVQQRMGETLKVPSDLSFRMMFDSRLKALLNKQYESTLDVVQAYKDYPDLKDNLRYNKEISDIRIYTLNQTLINNWEFMRPTKEQFQSAWYQHAIESKGQISWNYLKNEKKQGRYYLSLTRYINYPDLDTYAVLVIDVDPEFLYSILYQEPFTTFILDDQDQVVASNQLSWIGKDVSVTKIDTNVLNQGSGTFEVVVDGQLSRVFVQDMHVKESINTLRIATVFAVESIVGDANRIRWFGLSVMAISLVVAMLLIYGFSYLLSKRMLVLSNHMKRVSAGDLQHLVLVDGEDEVGQLSRQFQRMLKSINQLMDEVHEASEQKNQLIMKQNEIKFKMLASQINPHFLFNTLESIRMRAHLEGHIQLAKVVKDLGILMRNSLEVSGRDVTLTQEIAVVRSYLQIQQFRFGERLSYSLDIDPHVETFELPQLLIQPLVENAVLHGLESKMTGGEVKVHAVLDHDHVVIKVMDNGTGIPAERLEQIRYWLAMKEPEEQARVGLVNIHQRLQLYYGEGYGLTIDSEQDMYTAIGFRIPIGGSQRCIK